MKILYNNRVLWIIALLSVAFVSCNQRTGKKQPITDKEFEGIITYKILYRNFEDSALYGDTLKIYYSKGNLIKQFNGKDPRGLRREIFLTKDSKFYMNIGSSDTLYSFDITENKNHVHNSSKLLPYKDKILNHPCERLDIFETHKSDVTFYIDQSFIFSRDVLKINPEYFKNWRYGSFNMYINEAGSLYLRCETKIRYNENIDFGTKIYEAVEINEKVLDPKLFEVGTSIVKAFPL